MLLIAFEERVQEGVKPLGRKRIELTKHGGIHPTIFADAFAVSCFTCGMAMARVVQ
jgi:hypothetical protein